MQIYLKKKAIAHLDTLELEPGATFVEKASILYMRWAAR